MIYIGGINSDRHGKDVKVKRISNDKWYGLNDILKNIKEGYDRAEFQKLKLQFYSEYLELVKICTLFAIEIDKEFRIKRIIRDY